MVHSLKSNLLPDYPEFMEYYETQINNKMSGIHYARLSNGIPTSLCIYRINTIIYD